MLLLTLSAASLHIAEPVLAGGGPENTVLVVNQRSWASQTIANYYRALRRIPDSHLIYLDWSRSVNVTDVNTFRRDILGKILDEIKAKGLSQQIDYVVYSADFPYSVNFRKDLLQDERWTTASINGLTYFAPLVMRKEHLYRDLDANWYMRPWQMRPGLAPSSVPESRGFRTATSWRKDGTAGQSGGQHYLLSTMLGYTSGRGNSVSEVIEYLHRSSAADGTFPAGSIYFPQTEDIRSRVRHFAFPLVVEELRQSGVRAEIIDGALPQGRQDVAGLAMGVRQFSWDGARNQILPGAICDNFTSFGGVLRESSTQTPLTVFLRHGAAAASGTVIEPMSIIKKFPHPMLHVHYARGCSLAEAFYQSVRGPYQLLIVGDPLCQPWARVPEVHIEGLAADATIKGAIKLSPTVTGPWRDQIHHYEYFLDGKRIAVMHPGDTWTFDSRRFADGYHELSVVAVNTTAIQTQGRTILPLSIANTESQINASIRPSASIRWNEPFVVTAEAAGASEIIVYHNRRVLGRISGGKGELELMANQLGLGRVRLQLAGVLSGDRTQEIVLSKPIDMYIKPPPARSSLAQAPIGLVPGVALERDDAAGRLSVRKTQLPRWTTELGLHPGESFTLSGYTKVPLGNVYQFQLSITGDAQLYVNGDLIHSKTGAAEPVEYVPLALKPGWHEVLLRGKFAGKVHLHLAFGGPGTYAVGERQFWHVP